jgi:hypothetical protein
MRSIRLGICLIATTALLRTIAPAQWIHYRTASIPRSADGNPELAAPPPRTADGKPDLSGLWEPALGGADPQFADIAKNTPGGLPFQPWAADLVKARRADHNKDDPDGHCQPLGPVKIHLHPYPRKILHTPGLLVILYERDTVHRQIFTDGRPLPMDPQPSYYGYSTSKWDTLVVETTGFRDGLWLDIGGTPLTDAAKVTERFQRPNFSRLEIDVTVDDPMAYTKLWTIRVNQKLAPDTEGVLLPG